MKVHKDIPYLNHMLDAINDIEESIKNLSKKEFIINKDVKDANIRRLEIIGEAAKNLSKKIKDKNSDIEWKKIAGTRDIVVHHYFGIDHDIVWNIIKKDLPILKKEIEKIKIDRQ